MTTDDQERLAVLRAVRDCGDARFWGSFAVAAKLSTHAAERALISLHSAGHVASDRQYRRGGWYLTPAGEAELARLELLGMFQEVADAHGADLLYKVPAVRETTWASYDIMLAKRPDGRLVEIEWDYDAGKFLSTLWAEEWERVDRRVESDTIAAACAAATEFAELARLEAEELDAISNDAAAAIGFAFKSMGDRWRNGPPSELFTTGNGREHPTP